MKAVIMAGGRGTRFWPASRRRRPKQFLHWGQQPSLFRQTVDRLEGVTAPEDVFVVCPPEYRSQVLAEAPDLDESQLILEPVARNTAACLGLAATRLHSDRNPAVMAVLPADHLIADVEAFHQALETAAGIAAGGWLVTFGMTPTYAATGYGYLERGNRLPDQQESVFEVARFVEKPDAERAQRFVGDGRHFWNSGMFVWRTDVFLQAVQEHLPKTADALASLDWTSAPPERQLEVFSSLECISVDYGVMERAGRVAMVACDLGWNDVGSWDAVADLDLAGAADQDRRIVMVDSSNCVVEVSGDKVAALVGVDELIVVDTADALLICRRGQSQSLRAVIEAIEEADWKDLL